MTVRVPDGWGDLRRRREDVVTMGASDQNRSPALRMAAASHCSASAWSAAPGGEAVLGDPEHVVAQQAQLMVLG